MVLPLGRLNSVEYYNKPHNAWEDYYYPQLSPSRGIFLKNVPFCRGPVLQRGYCIGSIFKSVARSVMPSLKEIGKSALTTGLEVLQEVAKGENIKNNSKETSERKQSSVFGRYFSRIAPKKSIEGSRNKQIAISSSKPKKRKHQFAGVERNFSISHDHICISKLRYPRQTVLI